MVSQYIHMEGWASASKNQNVGIVDSKCWASTVKVLKCIFKRHRTSTLRTLKYYYMFNIVGVVHSNVQILCLKCRTTSFTNCWIYKKQKVKKLPCIVSLFYCINSIQGHGPHKIKTWRAVLREKYTLKLYSSNSLAPSLCNDPDLNISLSYSYTQQYTDLHQPRLRFYSHFM
jgi:hypothetical protein